MAKEVAISKRIKISEAQKHMLLAVIGASLVLGASIALTSHFIRQISFNTKVIMAEEESIVAYSNIIKDTGICIKPSGSVYSSDELDKCIPDSIEISQIPGTLRANILENLAANEALNSVPKENNSNCLDNNGKAFTYKDLITKYKEQIYTRNIPAIDISAYSLCKTTTIILLIHAPHILYDYLRFHINR